MMRSNTDPDVFPSKVFQQRDELSGLGEVVSNERLTTIILDVLSKERYSTMKMQSTRHPDLGIEETF